MTLLTWPRNHKPASTLKTYSHLAGARRIPTDYDLGTTGLLYYLERGFEVRTPIADWYEKYQKGTPLRSSAWEQFLDPRQTTYARYVARRRLGEAHADGILQTIDDTGYDRRLDERWVGALGHVLGPLRYALHGLQMVSAYLGSMAPGGRLAVVLLFQTADTMRCVQRLSYRMVQLRETFPGFGEDARAIWERDAAWQPLRKVVEHLLVTYDFGEALVALNLCIKPAVEESFFVHFAEEGVRRGDPLLEALLSSFWEDFRWQADWTRALFEPLVSESDENRRIVEAWSEHWRGVGVSALASFAPSFGGDTDALARRLDGRVRSRLSFGAKTP